MGTRHLPQTAAGPTSLWSFAGDWSLERRVEHDDGRIDRLSGTSRFAKTGPRLIQDDAGWLETPAGRFQASQRYVWTEAAGRLDLFFADMRPFHSVPLGDTHPETVHLCPPDRYHVAYDFSDWPVWRTVWSVEGPRKGYRMESQFTPAKEVRHLARQKDAVHKSGNV